MIKSINVLMNNSKFNYSTNVNFHSSAKDLRDYFVGTTFFMGTCDSQESDPAFNPKCIGIEILPVHAVVIAGSFKGEQGELKAGLNKNTFHVNGCLVTANQIEVL